MGAIYCLLSAIGFGVMAIFAKLAYDDGASVELLLITRFGLASAILVTVALARGAFRGLSRRTVYAGLAMGAVGYAAQATFYFAALTRLDASLVALIFYVYPITVMAAAVLLGRDVATRRRVWALGMASAGIVLVLSGASTGRFDVLGALLALGSALTYTGYILIGDRVAMGVPTLPLTALVCTGAFGTFVVSSTVRGGVDLDVGPSGWLWLGAIALVSTVGAIILFFAGLARVGPSVASLLSILEPVVTVSGAALVFGESMNLVQWVGGSLVLLAVVAVQWPARPVPPPPTEPPLRVPAAATT